MAFNSGQEAFQLFYERLLLIRETHRKDDLFLLTNRFHLTSIINTFNRHYCTGIGTETPTFKLGWQITPVYLNLGIYDDPALDLHRLIAIQLICNEKLNYRDNIYFVFDNPALGAKDGISPSDPQFRYPVFGITIDVFERSHYRPSVYQFSPSNYELLHLQFDEKSYNFTYSKHDGMTTYIHNTYNEDVEFPPLFGHLYMKGWDKEKMSDLCYDKRHVCAILGYVKGTFGGNTERGWFVPTKYIAHNRYKRVTGYQPEEHVLGYPSVDINDNSKKLLSFLFGADNMCYLFENFTHLTYNAKLRLSNEERNAIIIKAKSTNAKYYDEISVFLNKSGYESTVYDTKMPILDDDTMVVSSPLSRKYIKQYHTLNNYVNCIDACKYTIDRLIGTTTQSPNWPEKQFIDLHEIHDWYDNKTRDDDDDDDENIGGPEKTAPVVTRTIRERRRLETTLKQETKEKEYGNDIDKLYIVLNKMNK